MKTATVSRGGQISVPADVRRRWGVSRVLIEDRGDALVIRPLPTDPIATARGSLRAGGTSSDTARAMTRSEEKAAEERRLGR